MTEEEARERFERLAGGILQVTPEELEEEASKGAPSDDESKEPSEGED